MLKVNSPDTTLNFQVLLAIAFVVNTMFVFIPHFAIVSFLVLLEGIIGGIAYVNVYSYVHKNVGFEECFISVDNHTIFKLSDPRTCS